MTGLTPTKLARILKAIDTDTYAEEYLTLAEEMEEKDLHYSSVLRTRKLAVSSLPPRIEAASDKPEDVEIAEFVEAVLLSREYPSMAFDAMDAVAKGYSMVEILWDMSEERWVPKTYKYRDPRFFRYDMTDLETIRLIDAEHPSEGRPLPAYCFIYHLPHIKSGAPLRGGLARLAAFSFMCKNYTIKDWMAFAEVYGMPLRLGRYGPGASDEDIDTLKTAIQNLGQDAGAVVPEAMAIEFVDATRMTGSGAEPVFGGLADYLDGQVSKGVLGQTMTTDDGSSLAQAKVHGEVRDDIRDSDATNLATTLQRDLVVPLVDLNFGERRSNEYPQLVIGAEEPEDLEALSKALSPFIDRGLRIEASAIRDKFGLDEPAEDAEILTPKGGGGGNPAGPEPEPEAKPTGEFGEPPANDDADEEKAAARQILRVAFQQAAKNQDAIDDMVNAAARDWKPQMSPVVSPILALAERVDNYDDFTAGLPSVLAEMDSTLFAERLALETYKARGLGDAKDSTATLAAIMMPDLIALMAEATTVQTVVFDKAKYSAEQATAWLQENGFKAAKKDETEESLRYRQREPGDFEDGSFRTITLKAGIKAVIGRLK
jgi:phage gp29-like protein